MKRTLKKVPTVRPLSFKARIGFMVLVALISCIESFGQSAQNATPPPSSDASQLAQELTNPVASLISVPFQSNFDFRIGQNNGFRYLLNFQPVVPFRLTGDWNLISRTILPIVHQDDAVNTSSQTGLSDTVQSFFFSPAATEPFIWGVGPVLLLPTATDDLLGSGKLGLGPTFVILKLSGGLTYGALLNQIWSIAGDTDRTKVNATFIQPFLSYTTKSAWTFTLNTESTYDRESRRWSVPLHLQATKLLTPGGRPISVGGGLRCWASSAPLDPKGCGFRVLFTLLFPRG